MTQIPNPAQVAARVKAAADQAQERERVKVARRRGRLRKAARISTHVGDETVAALARVAHPEVARKGEPR